MSILQPGRTFVCELADFDACDLYFFSLQAGPTLDVAWKLKGCSDSGVVHHGKKALESARGFVSFNQGNVSRLNEDGDDCDDGCDCHTVPFVLSRSVATELANGAEVELNVFGQSVTFKKAGEAQREIEIDGKKTAIRCLHAKGDDGDIWIADDGGHTIVLRVESTSGENYAELQRVTKMSIEEVESSLSEE